MKDRYRVPGLDRALTMLELLAEHPDGLSMVEIAGQTGIPSNSVYRIATTLCARGYLARSAKTKRYLLTRKFLPLAFPSAQARNIVEVALDVMRELREAVGESTLLAVLSKPQGVVLSQMPAPHPIRLMVEPGTRFELHCSGPGKAMLAWLPETERQEWIATATLTRYTAETICDREQLEGELAEARRCGYAVDHGESFEGVHCVAAPVFDEHGRSFASIWVSGPSARLPVESLSHWGPVVREAADRVSQRLGYFAPERTNGHAAAPQPKGEKAAAGSKSVG